MTNKKQYDEGDLQKVERLFLRDCEISSSNVKHDERWSRRLRFPASLDTQTPEGNPIYPAPQISGELLSAIQVLLREETFDARFNFRGLKLIDFDKL